MKVLYITCSGVGGANQSLLSTIQNLIPLGVEPEIVVPNKKTSLLFEPLCKTHVVKIRLSIWPSLKGLKNILLFLPRLILYIIENISGKREIINLASLFKPDIIHTNVGVSCIGFKVAKKLNILHVWHIREYGFEDFGYRFFPSVNMYKKMMNSSYTISVTKLLESHFGLLHNKAIYDGVYQYNYFKTFKPKRKYFLFVGQLTSGKGVDFLINTFVKFFKSNLNYKLYLAGQGKQNFISCLKKKIEQNNLSDRIVFLGQRSDIADLMSESQALIVPSYKEGLGRITIEAMFNNCLVIGRNAAGTKEQFDNGYNLMHEEIAYRFNNEEQLLKLLELVSTISDCEIEKKTFLANKVVHQLYTLENNATNIFNYYKEIIEKGIL